MYVFRTVTGIRKHLDQQHGAVIGFIPTMGALHDGHLSLMVQAKEKCTLTVTSIFVNPTQFNDPEDLARYPRTLDHDLNVLLQENCGVAFVPEVEEVYPAGQNEPPLDLGGLDQSMEGMHRPGHFQGVAQVVRRLLEIVQPEFLYMGQKDFQQGAIVGHMIKTLGLPVTLVMCPTVRESNGLAMSSRNELLDPEIRSRASLLYKTLNYAADALGAGSIEKIQHECLQKLEAPGFKPEYFEIVDGHTLKPATQDTNFVVACCAVWAGDVRLIDNLILRDV